jgi:ribosomal protein S18 acetylase RimI-like enzyme
MSDPAGLVDPRHDLTASEIDAIEDRLYEHNSAATGRDDGEGLGFVIRDSGGKTVALTAGYTWAGVSEIKQMWVDPEFRGWGYGRALLAAMVTEAHRRGVSRIWVASYDFQAPGMYERAGFKRMAEFADWPEGRTNVILCKVFCPQGRGMALKD